MNDCFEPVEDILTAVPSLSRWDSTDVRMSSRPIIEYSVSNLTSNTRSVQLWPMTPNGRICSGAFATDTLCFTFALKRRELSGLLERRMRHLEGKPAIIFFSHNEGRCEIYFFSNGRRTSCFQESPLTADWHVRNEAVTDRMSVLLHRQTTENWEVYEQRRPWEGRMRCQSFHCQSR